MKTADIDILHRRMPDYMASFCLSLEEEVRSYPFGCGLRLKFEYDQHWGCLTIKAEVSYVTKSLCFGVQNSITAEHIKTLDTSNLKTALCREILHYTVMAK